MGAGWCMHCHAVCAAAALQRSASDDMFCSALHTGCAPQLTAAGKRSTTGSSRGMASMSLLPVLLVGLLAFLVGHYLTHVPLLTELLSSVLGDSKRV